MSLAWYVQSADEVLRIFATTAFGLSSEEAALRLDSYGPNELRAFERTSAWHTLAAQFKNVLIVILLAATVLSGLLGHALEASVIAIIVLFALLLGFIQEYRAERALEALRKMAAPLGHVIRDVERSIPSRDVVPGDLVVLRAGDRVPADCRITTAVNVYVPWLQGPFATFGLSVGDWILVTVLALTVVPVLEAVKWMERHEWFGELV